MTVTTAHKRRIKLCMEFWNKFRKRARISRASVNNIIDFCYVFTVSFITRNQGIRLYTFHRSENEQFQSRTAREMNAPFAFFCVSSEPTAKWVIIMIDSSGLPALKTGIQFSRSGVIQFDAWMRAASYGIRLLNFSQVPSILYACCAEFSTN